MNRVKNLHLGRLIFVSILLLWVTLPTAPPSAAPASLIIKDIRYGLRGKETRIVIDLSQKVDFRAFHLSDPYRIVVDVPAAKWSVAKTKLLGDKLIKSYRSGNLDGGITRIVFDMQKPAVISNAFPLARRGDNEDRVVIDLAPASVNLFTARKENIFGTLKPDKTKTAAKPSSSFRDQQNKLAEDAEPQLVQASAVLPQKPSRKPGTRKYTVVIDAGHGGEDPGALGGHVREKNLTLTIAKELKRQLDETGRYRAVLTRDRDVYVKLRDRVDLSRKMDGDLFISIHADKIGRTSVRGASIYTLSENASDAETARLADAENNSGVVAGVDLAQERPDVANILLDLAMRDKMNESNLLARFLEGALRSKNVRLLPNSHRAAGFAVLKAPDIPSVLIETGFLSNPDEARLLSSPSFQMRISSAILDGIDAYFRKIETLKKL